MAAGRSGPGPEEGPTERLPREHTLRRSADYLRCYRRGRRLRGALARVHYAPNELAHPRLGITASRKVGKAVVRNRLKRRVRELYRRWPSRGELPPVDLVVHLEPAAAAGSRREFSRELDELLRGVVRGEGSAGRGRGVGGRRRRRGSGGGGA